MIKAPKKSSVYSHEPKNEKYIIHFAPELITFIQEKRKYKTYRFGNQFDYLNPKDNIGIAQTGEDIVLLKAVVVSKSLVTFADLPLNMEGHEVYEDKEHQRKVFSGYYKFIGRDIRDDDFFIMIDFKLRED